MKPKINIENKINEMISDEEFITDKSELAQVFDSLDNDDIKSQNMSNIDFNTRLTKSESNGCLVMDELQRMGLLPMNFSLSRQKKRLAVSLNGEGRKEKIDIVRSERENTSSSGFLSKLGGIFKKTE